MAKWVAKWLQSRMIICFTYGTPFEYSKVNGKNHQLFFYRQPRAFLHFVYTPRLSCYVFLLLSENRLLTIAHVCFFIGAAHLHRERGPRVYVCRLFKWSFYFSPNSEYIFHTPVIKWIQLFIQTSAFEKLFAYLKNKSSNTSTVWQLFFFDDVFHFGKMAVQHICNSGDPFCSNSSYDSATMWYGCCLLAYPSPVCPPRFSSSRVW